MISGLQVGLRALQGTDPGMSLLTAVELVTYDPARRVALYRLCSPLDRGISGLAQADAKIASCLLSGDCCGERINDIRFAGDFGR